ncbi:MAG: MupG family TIM beta-alpha barrel fold protein [Bifidobacteriaceae bacterium]|jgi:hypothetical protein|nr:MupG family TIM beta-alpha barrel fold protein [Bifidobacteriaceae bacterium]
MRKLGISVYPNHCKEKDYLDYIDLAASFGVSHIFTCLLSHDLPKDELIKVYKTLTNRAKKHSMSVVIDVAPRLFTKFGIDYKDLAFFSELGVAGFRLDEAFTGSEESMMSFNKYGLQIELNASNATPYLDNIFAYQPKSEAFTGCHNFYPHKYTGLTLEHCLYGSKLYKKHGLPVSAFVSSPSAKFGPWDVSEGLCTLEMHRSMPLDVQAKHLWSTDLIDNVIIANMFASVDEFESLKKLDPYMLSFKVELEKVITPLDKKIVLEELHFNRGDVSPNVLRSTQSRVKYKNESFPVYNPADIKRGDLVIESSEYEHYAGELQIALADMKNSGRSNVVGHISSDELFLLDTVKPWQKFRFYESV